MLPIKTSKIIKVQFAYQTTRTNGGHPTQSKTRHGQHAAQIVVEVAVAAVATGAASAAIPVATASAPDTRCCRGGVLARGPQDPHRSGNNGVQLLYVDRYAGAL